MLELRDWMRHVDATQPWLIVGKGPSLDRGLALDLSGYRRVALNHAVRTMPVDVAHFIDLDAVRDSADAIRSHAQWLMMPLYPHVDFQPSRRSLVGWLLDVPVLREFSERGRLVWYYHRLLGHPTALVTDYPPAADPIIPVHRFSSEAVVGILARAGVRTLRTLGLDGGTAYASAFADLDEATRLANGQPHFDDQFLDIWPWVRDHGIDFGPLMESDAVTHRAEALELLARRAEVRHLEAGRDACQRDLIRTLAELDAVRRERDALQAECERLRQPLLRRWLQSQRTAAPPCP